MLRDALRDSSAGIDHLREVEGPSGTAVILVQPSGENSILIVGEDMHFGFSLHVSHQAAHATAIATQLQPACIDGDVHVHRGCQRS